MSGPANEEYFLRWDDFESNMIHSFQSLRDDKDLFDVTLVCDSGQVEAHKVILSGCSPFFRRVFKKNPHQHPLLFLRGVEYKELVAVLDFMYHGQVNLPLEDVDSFVAVAKDLGVRGISQNTNYRTNEEIRTQGEPVKRKIDHEISIRTGETSRENVDTHPNERRNVLYENITPSIERAAKYIRVENTSGLDNMQKSGHGSLESEKTFPIERFPQSLDLPFRELLSPIVSIKAESQDHVEGLEENKDQNYKNGLRCKESSKLIDKVENASDLENIQGSEHGTLNKQDVARLAIEESEEISPIEIFPQSLDLPFGELISPIVSIKSESQDHDESLDDGKEKVTSASTGKLEEKDKKENVITNSSRKDDTVKKKSQRPSLSNTVKKKSQRPSLSNNFFLPKSWTVTSNGKTGKKIEYKCVGPDGKIFRSFKRAQEHNAKIKSTRGKDCSPEAKLVKATNSEEEDKVKSSSRRRSQRI